MVPKLNAPHPSLVPLALLTRNRRTAPRPPPHASGALGTKHCLALVLPSPQAQSPNPSARPKLTQKRTQTDMATLSKRVRSPPQEVVTCQEGGRKVGRRWWEVADIITSLKRMRGPPQEVATCQEGGARWEEGGRKTDMITMSTVVRGAASKVAIPCKEGGTKVAVTWQEVCRERCGGMGAQCGGKAWGKGPGLHTGMVMVITGGNREMATTVPSTRDGLSA